MLFARLFINVKKNYIYKFKCKHKIMNHKVDHIATISLSLYYINGKFRLLF